MYDFVCAALAVAFFPKFFQRLGRKYTMMIGASCFLVGAALQASQLLVCPPHAENATSCLPQRCVQAYSQY